MDIPIPMMMLAHHRHTVPCCNGKKELPPLQTTVPLFGGNNEEDVVVVTDIRTGTLAGTRDSSARNPKVLAPKVKRVVVQHVPVVVFEGGRFKAESIDLSASNTYPRLLWLSSCG